MDHLGRYQIVRELGRGGMGVVYLGVDPAIGRQVAIKTLQFGESASAPAIEGARDLRARLLREARAAGALIHPNIVAVFDIGEDAGVAYIVMEFIEGRTLEVLAGDSTSQLQANRIVDILLDVAKALDFAHAHGVVHRDIKPANIIVQGDMTVKLADFGIAKLLDAEGITSASKIIGTPHFLSPEQLKSEPITGRSDQFALGVISYTLLTGKRPFEADNAATLFSKILFEQPASSSLVSDETNRVLQKSLAKDPSERFETCSSFMSALKASITKPTGETAGSVSAGAGLVENDRGKTRLVRFRPLLAGAILIAMPAAVMLNDFSRRAAGYAHGASATKSHSQLTAAGNIPPKSPPSQAPPAVQAIQNQSTKANNADKTTTRPAAPVVEHRTVEATCPSTGFHDLTGLLIFSSAGVALTINPSTTRYLRISVLNADDEIVKSSKDLVGGVAGLVDARIDIVSFTGPYSADGRLVNAKRSSSRRAPLYDTCLKRMPAEGVSGTSVAGWDK